MTDHQPEDGKRRLRVHINPHMVANMLELPAGHRLVAVEARNDPLGVVAICEGPTFPLSPHEAESPVAQFRSTVIRDPENGDVLHVHREMIWWDGDTMMTNKPDGTPL